MRPHEIVVEDLTGFVSTTTLARVSFGKHLYIRTDILDDNIILSHIMVEDKDKQVHYKGPDLAEAIKTYNRIY